MKQLQRFFDSYFDGQEGLRRVLDAGSGFELPLHIPMDAHLTAIDISESQLAKNENADERIIGDIQTWRSPPGMFDAVICWWVLEHLPRPQDAIARLAESLRTNGLLVIGVPYLWGFKALATKVTPYSFHVWLVRRAGPIYTAPGVDPFPTFLRIELSPARLRRIARSHSLDVVYEHTHDTNPERILPRPLQLVWKGMGTAVKYGTFGRYNPLLTEHIVVFRKE